MIRRLAGARGMDPEQSTPFRRVSSSRRRSPTPPVWEARAARVVKEIEGPAESLSRQCRAFPSATYGFRRDGTGEVVDGIV